ncbi:MAG: HDOD domain-containing protein [Fimbriimonadales bacterium]
MLRPLPQAVSRLVELMENETTTLAEVEALLLTEPVLCGRMLQVANSAYYGLPREISSIRQALLLLGAHTVKGMALSVAVVASLRDKPTITAAERALWRCAVRVAGYAQGIARECRLGALAMEDAYVAGLLHDIGKLFLLTRFPEAYQPILQSGSAYTNLQQERKIFGYDHAEIGAMIAERWRLPERVVRVIGEHHAPFVPEGDIRLLTACVMQADIWDAEAQGVPMSETTEIVQELSQILRIDEVTAQQIRQHVDDSVDALCKLMLG